MPSNMRAVISVGVASSYFALVLAAAPAAGDPLRATVQVPFVGCASDGQLGPRAAPRGLNVLVYLKPDQAENVAYYKSEDGPGVLAPRRWHCFGTYGSNGEFLFVTPQRVDPAQLFSTTWNGFAGPAVAVGYEYGGTSGRFAVASAIARVFPSHMAFASKVIAEGLDPSRSFPRGPYPADKLHYRNDAVVEYETQPHNEGLGTQLRLRENADPIRGIAMLIGRTPDLLSLSVRLPSELSYLSSSIIQRVEQEALHPLN